MKIMSSPLIQFDKVTKSFGTNHVLNSVEFSVKIGEIAAIIGKSGTGKSVLLKHIIGLIKPDSGNVLFNGKNTAGMSRMERRAFKNSMSYMFQGNALFDSMTIFDNIALPLRENTSLSKKKIKEKVREKTDQLDLYDIDNKYPSQISGGMKKRVALARALITDPEIVLFDEPTTGLDPIRKHAVHQMICDYQREFGFTGIMVSHEIPDIFHITQRIIMLDEGIVIFEGSPDDIRQSVNPAIVEFIKGLETRQDELPGLAPHSQGVEKFNEELARLNRYSIPFSIIILTVENINEINAKLGHITGQTVLKNFADRVQQHIRLIDSCSRCGFDKLMIILPSRKVNEARTVCVRLASELSRSEILDSEAALESEICFRISAAFIEAEKDSRLEDIISYAEVMESIRYEFRVC